MSTRTSTSNTASCSLDEESTKIASLSADERTCMDISEICLQQSNQEYTEHRYVSEGGDEEHELTSMCTRTNAIATTHNANTSPRSIGESPNELETIDESIPKISRWKAVLCGQGIALCLSICCMTSAALQDIDGIKSIPLFQLSTVYLSLCIHLIFLKRERSRLQETELETERVESSFNKSDDEDRDDRPNENTSLITNMTTSNAAKNCSVGTLILANKSDSDPSYTQIQHHSRCGCHKKQNLGILLHSPWYFYALLAFLDVQANYFVVLSFRYTAAINSTILGSLSILSVMMTSRFLLGRVFQRNHFVGALFCILGASCIVSSDFKFFNGKEDSLDDFVQVDLIKDGSIRDHKIGDRDAGVDESGDILQNSRLLGDTFAISAALLFGLNDTLAEYTVQKSTPNEYLSMLGVFGFIFSLSQSLIFERHQVSKFLCFLKDQLLQFAYRYIDSSLISSDQPDYYSGHNDSIHGNPMHIFAIWSSYIAAFYLFYVSASHFLTTADATIMTLSLQTSNIWTMIFSVFAQQFKISPSFFCSAGIIVFGVWLYERGPHPTSVSVSN